MSSFVHRTNSEVSSAQIIFDTCICTLVSVLSSSDIDCLSQNKAELNLFDKYFFDTCTQRGKATSKSARTN